MKNAIKTAFQKNFGQEPQITVRSPGRINLIGEHTDYNNGLVLPAAIDKAVWFAASPRPDDRLHFVANDFGQKFNGSIHQIQKSGEQNWANYLLGVLSEFQKSGARLGGLNLVFGGDLPIGGGVSSSAAIENGVGFLANELFGLGFSRLDLLKNSQRAENNFVGMNCGIMDMFASMMGRENQVIRLDCRSLDFQYFPFSAPEFCLVLCDTGVKHQLVDSEYNVRRAECEEGVSVLKNCSPGVSSLRDVSLDLLLKHRNDLRPIVFQRCFYVVKEIERVEKACAALSKNDFQTLGQLMNETHEGLNLEYQVSCPELNFLAGYAKNQPFCLGSRMMGGGFGGCTINLVRWDFAGIFIENLKTAYERAFGRDMVSHVVRLAGGTAID